MGPKIGRTQASFQEAGKTGIRFPQKRLYAAAPPHRARQRPSSSMRACSMVSHWVIEEGSENGAIEVLQLGRQTFIDIKDYEKVRPLRATAERSAARIKSRGRFRSQ